MVITTKERDVILSISNEILHHVVSERNKLLPNALSYPLLFLLLYNSKRLIICAPFALKTNESVSVTLSPFCLLKGVKRTFVPCCNQKA